MSILSNRHIEKINHWEIGVDQKMPIEILPWSGSMKTIVIPIFPMTLILYGL